jgi:hypothetical protein
MKKEYLGVLSVGLIIFGQAIDSLNGSLALPISNPFQFLSSQILTTYPLTALSVSLKVLAIVLICLFFAAWRCFILFSSWPPNS